MNIFAKNAETTIPDTPVTGTAYRNDALDASEMEAGFNYSSTASSADYNQLEFLISEFADLIERSGVLPWDASTKYKMGSVVINDDNAMYQSVSDNNVNNAPSESAEWAPITEKINNLGPFLRIDLGNATTTGSNVTIVTSNGPTINSPIVGTQPAGTSNDVAASTAFVQNAVDNAKIKPIAAVVNKSDLESAYSITVNDVFTITEDAPLNTRVLGNYDSSLSRVVASGTWQVRGVLGKSVLLGRV